MPRRPKPPPLVLRVEGLSDGQPMELGEPMVDDFTGEAIKRVWPDARPVEPLPSAQSILDAANVAKHRENQLLLQAAGIIPKSVPAEVHASPPTKPKPKPTAITLVRMAKLWRRV